MSSVYLSAGHAKSVWHSSLLLSAILICICVTALNAADTTQTIPNDRVVIRLCWGKAVQRAGQTEKVCARLDSPSEGEIAADAEIVVPKGLKLKSPARQRVTHWSRIDVFDGNSPNPRHRLEKLENATVTWEVEAVKPFEGEVEVIVSSEGLPTSRKTLHAKFTKPIKPIKADYIPRPCSAKTDYLIGANYFSGWKPGDHVGWSVMAPFPDKQPALGWYDENSPEVTDWQIKWALEHGVNFFNYCWFREPGTEGHPITQIHDHGIHSALFKSRYGSLFKFCIMWEDQGGAGVSSVDDLMSNLLPYWIDNYFKRPNYVLIDNKPLLFVYDPAKLEKSLGGVANVRKAIDMMRQACVKAGFGGLVFCAEYRYADPAHMRSLAACGFDATFAYCWEDVPQNASDERAVEVQMKDMRDQLKCNYLPSIPLISMGWNPEPWETYCNYPHRAWWRVSPNGYEMLCKRIKEMMDSNPKDQISHRLALLDNWNEYGEGHYVFPTMGEGFGYLDAVRNVFARDPKTHIDIVPEDVGLGPYDRSYNEWVSKQQERIRQSGYESGK